jgi:hypothetical protein
MLKSVDGQMGFLRSASTSDRGVPWYIDRWATCQHRKKLWVSPEVVGFAKVRREKDLYRRRCGGKPMLTQRRLIDHDLIRTQKCDVQFVSDVYKVATATYLS